jgi:hypothetical protein
MKKFFIVFVLLINLKSYGQGIFRYVDIYPNGIIHLDSTLSIGNKYYTFKNDSILALKEGTFSGCKSVIIRLNSKKRVKVILFYYPENFEALHYISELDQQYNRPVISYQRIQNTKYKIYSWIDSKTILEFKSLIEVKYDTPAH